MKLKTSSLAVVSPVSGYSHCCNYYLSALMQRLCAKCAITCPVEAYCGKCASDLHFHLTPRLVIDMPTPLAVWLLSCLFCCMQHPGSITQTEPADMETDGVDSDDDNDVLKSDQVCLFSRIMNDVLSGSTRRLNCVTSRSQQSL